MEEEWGWGNQMFASTASVCLALWGKLDIITAFRSALLGLDDSGKRTVTIPHGTEAESLQKKLCCSKILFGGHVTPNTALCFSKENCLQICRQGVNEFLLSSSYPCDSGKMLNLHWPGEGWDFFFFLPDLENCPLNLTATISSLHLDTGPPLLADRNWPCIGCQRLQPIQLLLRDYLPVEDTAMLVQTRWEDTMTDMLLKPGI